MEWDLLEDQDIDGRIFQSMLQKQEVRICNWRSELVNKLILSKVTQFRVLILNKEQRSPWSITHHGDGVVEQRLAENNNIKDFVNMDLFKDGEHCDRIHCGDEGREQKHLQQWGVTGEQIALPDCPQRNTWNNMEISISWVNLRNFVALLSHPWRNVKIKRGTCSRFRSEFDVVYLPRTEVCHETRWV